MATASSTFVPQHIEDVGSPDEIRLRKTNTIILSGDDVSAKRQEILQYFLNTYDVYEKLFECLKEKAFFMRADPLRHPLIFYYGHTAVLFINKLRLAKVVKARVNKKYESMFAIGVDEMSWDDLLPDHYDWPTVQQVKAYRDEVRAVVEEAIQRTPLKLPITWDDPFWAILMGIEHERIHLETSSVLIRQLPLEVLNVHPFWSRCPVSGEPPANELLPVTDVPVQVTLGKPYDANLYGWDNEYGSQTTTVTPFKASKYLVTNREYLEFVEDQGSYKKELWTDEGWRFAQFLAKNSTPYPRFWVPSVDMDNKPTFRFRTMLEVIDMPWDWPVEVNNLEAKAFCNWKASKTGRPIRLPQEDEYWVLRQHVEGDHPHWARSPGNLGLEYYCSSTPVTAYPPTKTGFYDVIGNVWQHTETPIDAFKGFRVHEWYDDFSVPTFDLQHNLIKGGSWISTGNEAQNFSRYAFRRHFYQCAGIRYIESERKVQLRSDVYERDSAVDLYALFHFGSEYYGVPNFAKAAADAVIPYVQGRPHRRALDLGCAVGRTAFELARNYDHVIGLDFSARFIRYGVALKEKGFVKYSAVEEGDLLSEYTATLTELKLNDVKDKVEFWQADACNLDPRYSSFDLVTAINLIDRLYDPRIFLNMIHERIHLGGILVIGDPYTWSEEYTPKEYWIGGYKDKDGKAVTTLDGLKKHLEPHFKLIGGPFEIPFVIRETKHKFQHSLSEFTVWKRIF